MNIYQLSESKLAGIQKAIERRAFKDRLGDRRGQLRVDAAGAPERDRRFTNRLANARGILKTA